MRHFLLATVIALAGCATTAGISKQVQVYSEESALIKGCKMLTPIEATAAAISFRVADERARVALQDQARKVGGDGVVVTLVHNFGFGSSNMQGIAVRCFDAAEVAGR